MDTPTDGPTTERLALLGAYEDAEEIMSRLGALGADLTTLLEGRDAERAELTIKDAKVRTNELWTLMNKRRVPRCAETIQDTPGYFAGGVNFVCESA